ncbi:hypothetical protein GCM10010924_58220 [Rhizobium wenxiniae]|nr:hypothetical protein GCM10010924_58220 [Rhizobium wenxiniae]
MVAVPCCTGSLSPLRNKRQASGCGRAWRAPGTASLMAAIRAEIATEMALFIVSLLIYAPPGLLSGRVESSVRA